MTRPGTRLRALARRLCGTTTMERVIDPAIADLQHEYEDAVRRGLIWRSRGVVMAGYIAFARVTAIAVIERVLNARIVADDRAVVRTLFFSLAAIVVLTALVVSPSLSMGFRLGKVTAPVVFYLVPQAIAVTLPMSLVFGILLGLRNRTATTQVTRTIVLFGVGCTVAAFVLVALLLPAANQTFRELAAGRPLARGYNELTLDELASGDLGRMGPTVNVDPQRLAGEFEFRLALAFAPLALSVFSLSVAAARRNARGPSVVSLAALAIAFGYYALLYGARQAMVARVVPPAIAVWTPNLMCFLAALLLLRRIRLKPDTTDAST